GVISAVSRSHSASATFYSNLAVAVLLKGSTRRAPLYRQEPDLGDNRAGSSPLDRASQSAIHPKASPSTDHIVALAKSTEVANLAARPAGTAVASTGGCGAPMTCGKVIRPTARAKDQGVRHLAK